MPQHLVMPRLSAKEQATKDPKELIHGIKNPGPQTPFTIRESQLQAINMLEKLFNTIKLEITQTTVLPRELTTIAPTRVPVTVPSPRVSAEVTPPRVMTPRTPMITQEYPIEYRRQRDTV